MHMQLYGKKIWLYQQAVDFRRSIDGLSYIVTDDMGLAVKDGIFLFLNRKRDKLKGLSWHKNGFVMIYKRLEKGVFKMGHSTRDRVEVSVNEMSWLLAGLEWSKMREWPELDYHQFS